MTATTATDHADLLGVRINPGTLPETILQLCAWRKERRPGYVCCVAVHGLVLAQRDPAVRSALNGAALATTDGMPLVWLSRRAGFNRASRVCGPDLMDGLIAAGVTRGHRHYFYGGTPAVLDQLISRLSARHPGMIVAGSFAPPFRPATPDEDAAQMAAITAARPDFVWVGLGMPKQEKWMAAHADRLPGMTLIGVGAAFDFHAGIKARAPSWMQRTGTEWLFRLACEPRRLARRYIVDNGLFLAYLTGAAAPMRVEAAE